MSSPELVAGAVSPTPQLCAWQGDFGRAYTDRNPVDWRSRVAAFRTILDGLELERVLEVGCNRGHNLVAVREALGPCCEPCGVEPNAYARTIARRLGPPFEIVDGSVFHLPFDDGAFDLVFTSCMLIHVRLADLPAALREMQRVSRRCLLSIEYDARAETAIHYRGHDDLLWKRDFRRHYEETLPGVRLVRSGALREADGFDECGWWLFET